MSAEAPPAPASHLGLDNALEAAIVEQQAALADAEATRQRAASACAALRAEQAAVAARLAAGEAELEQQITTQAQLAADLDAMLAHRARRLAEASAAQAQAATQLAEVPMAWRDPDGALALSGTVGPEEAADAASGQPALPLVDAVLGGAPPATLTEATPPEAEPAYPAARADAAEAEPAHRDVRAGAAEAERAHREAQADAAPAHREAQADAGDEAPYFAAEDPTQLALGDAPRADAADSGMALADRAALGASPQATLGTVLVEEALEAHGAASTDDLGVVQPLDAGSDAPSAPATPAGRDLPASLDAGSANADDMTEAPRAADEADLTVAAGPASEADAGSPSAAGIAAAAVDPSDSRDVAGAATTTAAAALDPREPPHAGDEASEAAVTSAASAMELAENGGAMTSASASGTDDGADAASPPAQTASPAQEQHADAATRVSDPTLDAPLRVSPFAAVRRRRPGAEAEPPREAPRAPLQVEVGLRGEDNLFVGFSENISEGGLFVATYEPRPVGERLPLQFSLPGGATIACDVEVSWTIAHQDAIGADDGDRVPGMGLRFINLSEEAREALAAFVSKRPPLFHPG